MRPEETLHTVRGLLVQAARRHSRVAHEIEDLAHDPIVAACARGVPLTSDAFLNAANGSARRHGAFLARSAIRHRSREIRAADELLVRLAEPPREEDSAWSAPRGLSPALETTLLLLLAGHDKAELRALLGINDVALRKRFVALRKLGPGLGSGVGGSLRQRPAPGPAGRCCRWTRCRTTPLMSPTRSQNAFYVYYAPGLPKNL